MRISPFVLLSALTAAACNADPLPSVTDGASETGTETGTGTDTDTDTSTTATPTTTQSDDLCVPGSSAGCTCPNGNMGSQECNADGKSYGMCECEGGGSNSNSDGTLEPTSTSTDGVTTTTTTEGTTTEETTTEGTSSTETGEDTTTEGVTCDDPGPEPNNSEANAIDLGEQGCGAMAETVEGVLDGEDDIDWFSYHGVWNGLCIVGPNTRHTLTASDDVRLCVFADCDQGSADFNCPNGTTETDSPSGGHPGCCGEGVMNLNFNFGCGLLNPNNARLFIRVDQAPADACVEYSVDYDYDT
ncbi:hypothetical protein OV203_12135 [Nannocystis sp. ILAH1]|uniref:hypothetical protein n=1 Tax=Nannocystis sp. ILAH1 TaxID=2996789 RepID=UPI002270FE18|nr:hypothetical protein [Nannocystis sp. ILAH1]MCY0987878.1 hypothetical protein [Nannocystis sp. ILAH1]